MAPSEESRTKLAEAFQASLFAGDVDAFARLLADDAVLYTDGGGKRKAALNPIYGRDKIVRFLLGVSKKSPHIEHVDRVQINGLPGSAVWRELRHEGRFRSAARRTARSSRR